MPIDHWDFLPTGGIELYPFRGWEMASTATFACVRLLYSPSEEACATGDTVGLQLSMSPAQMRQLAEGLLQTAKRIEDLKPAGPLQ